MRGGYALDRAYWRKVFNEQGRRLVPAAHVTPRRVHFGLRPPWSSLHSVQQAGLRAVRFRAPQRCFVRPSFIVVLLPRMRRRPPGASRGGLRDGSENARDALRIATVTETPGFELRAHVSRAACAARRRTRGVSGKQWRLIYRHIIRLICPLSSTGLRGLVTWTLRMKRRRPVGAQRLAGAPDEALGHKRRRPPGFPWAAFRKRRKRLLGSPPRDGPPACAARCRRSPRGRRRTH